MPAITSCPNVKPQVLRLERFQEQVSVAKAPKHLFETSAAREAAKQAEYNAGRRKAITEAPYKERYLRVRLSETSDETVQFLKVPNGLVHTLATAYNQHLHVIIRSAKRFYVACVVRRANNAGSVSRPDDVWHALLAQFSIYVQANSEALRGQFVSHEGKKE
ncbi:hypothetical protein DL93DRAFT_827955 [Clavulina sp. PMI_390]|nr:hypothetical protein DL93DRAFT_827955 [Clavulina sp. PMI_390]